MELSINQSYLCQQLIEINKKYESCTFVDIDFVDLYGLNNGNGADVVQDLNIIKKKIVTKYYNLALKYHPDKYINNSESVIGVKGCFIGVDEIKNGQFLAFINDIHELLLNLITEEPESLLNIINGKTEDILNKYDLNADHNILKRRYNNDVNTEYQRATANQIKQFEDELQKSLIVDTKLDAETLQNKRDEEVEKRNEFKVEEVFTQEELNELNQVDEYGKSKFNSVFNSAFENHKDNVINNVAIDEANNNTFEQMFDTTMNIQPFNFNAGQNTLAYGSLANTISDLSEAFVPIKISKTPTQTLTLEQMMAQRKEQDNLFINAKLSKAKGPDSPSRRGKH